MTFYPERSKYHELAASVLRKTEKGDVGPDQLKELKRLHKETERQRRAVSDWMLDSLIPRGAAEGKF